MIDCVRPPRWVVFFSSPVGAATFGIVVASVALSLAWVIHAAARSNQGKPYFGQPRVALAMLVTSSSLLAFLLAYLFDPSFLPDRTFYNEFGPSCGTLPPEMAWTLIAAGAGMLVAWGVVARGLSRPGNATVARPNGVTAENVMDSDTRRRIKALVAANPGIHFSRIKGQLGMSPRTIRDQLRVLVRFGHVTSMDVDGKASYVVPGSVPEAAPGGQPAVPVLSFVQRGGRESVVAALLSAGETSFGGLLSALHEPRSNVRRKVEALESRGYVVVARKGREMASIRLAPGVEAIVRQARDPLVQARS
ncbi:MAG: hypothetical protein JW839_19030 [Candidatus Lokiarchaeota archaeon]|nr:hypothetical protein [Candidatus Lokiarchaeota archaeon]